MKNQIAASILRNIVAQFAGVNARQIKLEGEISPEFSCQNRTMDGSLGSGEDSFKLWGWSAETGFVQIDEVVGIYDDSNYAHYSKTDTPGKTLHTIPGVDKYIFFILNQSGYSKWSGSENREWNNWTLYKAPNFQQIWGKVEENDVARWEQFLTV